MEERHPKLPRHWTKAYEVLWAHRAELERKRQAVVAEAQALLAEAGELQGDIDDLGIVIKAMSQLKRKRVDVPELGKRFAEAEAEVESRAEAKLRKEMETEKERRDKVQADIQWQNFMRAAKAPLNMSSSRAAVEEIQSLGLRPEVPRDTILGTFTVVEE